MSGKRKPDEVRHLARVEDGWQLRVPPWLPGGGYTRFFGDAKYGTEKLALEAARAERDRLFDRADISLDPGGKRTFRRSPTLIVGVCLAQNGRRSKGGERVLYWGAYWSESGIQQRRLFSVQRLGFLGAWESAVAERMSHVEHRYSEAEMLQARAECLLLWAKQLSGNI